MNELPDIKENTATSCISIIAPKMNINDLRNFVNKEYSTAKNIKNRENRQSVVTALNKIIVKLSTIKNISSEGIAIYAHCYI